MRLAAPRWTRPLPDGFVVAVATVGPLGRRMPAPGTWGSAAGTLYFAAAFSHASIGAILLASLIAGYVGVAFCGEAEVRLRKNDPGEVILDEVLAMPLVFLGWRALWPVAPGWVLLLVGFGLFRLFDILKPLGISRLQRLPGGWGVMADDYVAALAACASLHIGAWLWLHR